jgi:hypothetical protein
MLEETGIYEPRQRDDASWQNTRTPRVLGEPPFFFCDHRHRTFAEAAACRDFGRETMDVAS